ncbi:MAG: hypothetical protein ABIP14_10775 [Blastocatellia bacterium]
MSTAMQTIHEKAQLLPPQKQAKVIDFIEELLEEDQAPATRGLGFDWVDDEDEVQTFEPSRDNKRNLAFDWVVDSDAEPEPLTSVELQHLATKWRIEDELDLK